MVYDKIIEGKYVNLISATVDDAEFTRNIRMSPEFSQFFPSFNNTIEQQIEWIKKQREKEGDYFFVVWDKNENRIGTISIYNINGEQGESGRLVIKGNSFQSIEAQLLLFDFSFDVLHLSFVKSYTLANNERAFNYSMQFGGVFGKTITRDDGLVMRELTFYQRDVDIATKKIKSIMYRKN